MTAHDLGFAESRPSAFLLSPPPLHHHRRRHRCRRGRPYQQRSYNNPSQSKTHPLFPPTLAKPAPAAQNPVDSGREARDKKILPIY
jgi:hypothetical protein